MSATIQVTGEIVEIDDVKIISDNFKKREFILLHAPNPEYPDYLKLEVVQNKTDLLDKYKVGQHVDVDINLKGKKWEKGKESGYFNSLQAWRIQEASAGSESEDNEPW
tara:strand:+ start:119 stop:442 length:324 start_codon:yes stop_codon:yes gene_type:complete